MGRSGYTDDDGEDPLALGRWRAQVASAIRGKRGQKFLRDLVAALDAMPEKVLVKNEIENEEGQVCGLGALGRIRGMVLAEIDSEDHDDLGKRFDIAPQLAQEAMYMNDEYYVFDVAGAERWRHVRAWAVRNIPCLSGLLPRHFSKKCDG